MAKLDEAKAKHEEHLAKSDPDKTRPISDDELAQGMGEVKIPRTPRTMTGKELIEALKETGTGENKLRLARRELRENPNLTAEAVLNLIAKSGQRPAHELEPFGFNVHTETLRKARLILQGYSPKEIAEKANKTAQEMLHVITESPSRVILQANEQPPSVPMDLLQLPI